MSEGVPTFDAYPWGRPQEACVVLVKLVPIERATIDKVVLLNAVIPPKRPTLIAISPISAEGAKKIVAKAKTVESYIGHEATAKLLSELLSTSVPVNRGEYAPKAGDVAIVVRLKRRLQTPQDVKEVKPEDLEFYVVSYELEA
jgi:hypothetical protein